MKGDFVLSDLEKMVLQEMQENGFNGNNKEDIKVFWYYIKDIKGVYDE